MPRQTSPLRRYKTYEVFQPTKSAQMTDVRMIYGDSKPKTNTLCCSTRCGW